MLELIILSVVFMVPLSVCLYQIIRIRLELPKIKLKTSQNNIALRVIHKTIQEIDKKLDANSTALNNFNQENRFSHAPADLIEHQYERAKRILKKGGLEEPDILHSCQMTEEEIELLTDLMRAEQ